MTEVCDGPDASLPLQSSLILGGKLSQARHPVKAIENILHSFPLGLRRAERTDSSALAIRFAAAVAVVTAPIGRAVDLIEIARTLLFLLPDAAPPMQA
jgi:VanZ family protein